MRVRGRKPALRWASLLAAAVVGVAAAPNAGLSAPVLRAAQLDTPAVELLATALIMGGTGQIISVGPSTPAFITDFVAKNYNDYIAPSGLCTGGVQQACDPTALYTPEQMFPLTGLADMTIDESVAAGRVNLDDCIRGVACTITLNPYTSTGVQPIHDTVFVVTGGSQSAVISTFEKSDLIAHPVANTKVSFVLLANPNRPNGGLLERFVGLHIPILGMTFNGATPTNSPQPNPLTTVDITRQYDGWSDFPVNPLNLLADANAILGAAYLHASYFDMTEPPLLQGRYQDSTYYLYPTDLLPVLMPLAAVPFVGMPLAKALDAPLRVLVEAGYNRTINPGAPTPAQWLYVPNPLKTLADFAVAIPTGWDDAIAYVTGDPANRPFHTAPQGVYGVGGPPVNAGSVDPYGPTPPAQAVAVDRTAASAAARTVRMSRPIAETAAAADARSGSKATATRVEHSPSAARATRLANTRSSLDN